MSEACRHALGGCIPIKIGPLPHPVPTPHCDARPSLSLVGERALDPTFWPVKYQGARGTCNAFAVNAAEELHHWLQDPSQPVTSLSDEYLYSMMREIGFADPRLDLGLDDKAIATRERSGATYLAQARLALMDRGVCAESYAPYTLQKAINYHQPNFSDAAHADAATRRVTDTELTHYIVEPGEDRRYFGLARSWAPPLEKDGAPQTCSDVIYSALAEGNPVVAGFGILSEVGYAAWFGLKAVKFGSVQYPSETLIAQERLAPAGGHAVCIVGYEQGPEPDTGWFLFRNSFGDFGFSADRSRDRLAPVAVARGYGYIVEADVDRYCWEILHRSTGFAPEALVA